MKILILALMLVATVAEAKTITVPISLQFTGLFPADFESHFRVTLPNAHEEAFKQIIKACGTNPQVTDLNLKTALMHNDLPGTATVAVKGTATCVIK